MSTAPSIDRGRLAADVVTALEARGATRHGDELQFRCLSEDHEDVTPSASYNILKRVHKCQGCDASGGLYGGDHPISQLLDFDLDSYRNNGTQPQRQPSRSKKNTSIVSWPIRDPDDGHVLGVHCRRNLTNGKKDGRPWWTGPNGEKKLGRKVVDLPLYAAHFLGNREPGDDMPVIVCEGEPATAVVTEATAEYEKDSDPLAAFLDEVCVLSPCAEARAGELYQHYSSWAEHHKLTQKERLSNTMFGRKMTERYEKFPTSTGAVYRGIGCRKNDA